MVVESSLKRKCPSCIFLITFYPPSVKYREVKCTVHDPFFTRSSGCLKRACWRIHPYITTLNQHFGKIHTVILKEEDASYKFRTFRTVSYTHLRAHETDSYLVCRLL